MLSKVLKMLYVMAAHSCGKMISPCYGMFFLSVSLTYMTFPSHSAGQLFFYGTWKPKVNILVAVMATSLGFFYISVVMFRNRNYGFLIHCKFVITDLSLINGPVRQRFVKKLSPTDKNVN